MVPRELFISSGKQANSEPGLYGLMHKNVGLAKAISLFTWALYVRCSCLVFFSFFCFYFILFIYLVLCPRKIYDPLSRRGKKAHLHISYICHMFRIIYVQIFLLMKNSPSNVYHYYVLIFLFYLIDPPQLIFLVYFTLLPVHNWTIR